MRLYLALLLAGDKEPKAWEYRRCMLEMELVEDGTYMNASPVVFPLARSWWGTATALAITEAARGSGLFLKIGLPKTHAIDVGTQVEVPVRTIVLKDMPTVRRPTIWSMLKEPGI